MKKKRVISILLSLLLLLGFVPFSATPARAATLTGNLVIDSSNNILQQAPWPSSNKANDLLNVGYHWDYATSTLTLKDLTITGSTTSTGSILLFEPGLTLELEGTNVVSYGMDGGLNSVGPGWLTIKGSGSLALNARIAGSGYAVYQKEGTIVVDGTDGCRVTINHRTASDPYAFLIEDADPDQDTSINSLRVINGATLRVEGGGVAVAGMILVDGANSLMTVAASRASLLETAVMCGMLEIKGGGELSINDTSTGDRITALWAFGTYDGAPGTALRVNDGTLYAAGRYQGADLFGDVYIGNGAKTTFYSVIGDGLIITRDLHFAGDYYFYAASGVSFWGLGFAFRLVGNQIFDSPGSPKIVKGSRYSTTLIDMDILPSYSYFNGIWLGILSAGWVAGNGNLLKRFKIMPDLVVNSVSVPDSTVGTAIAPIDFSLGVSGGVAPYTYQFYGPSWLSMDAAGMITGTPTAPAAATIAMVTVTDSDTTFGNPRNTRTVVVPVGKVVGDPLAFVYSSAFDIPASTVNVAIAPVDVKPGVSGGTVPYVFSMAGPSWLSIDPITGIITGTPPAAAAATTATITVTDCADTPASASITINVGEVLAPLTFTNYGWGVPSSEIGKPILAVDVSSGVAGGKAPYTFTIARPANWPLLTINPATGVISGTAPATIQAATSAVITVTDALGATASITIPVGAVSEPLVASDLAFFHYPDFDVPRTYPGIALNGTPTLPPGVTCSVQPVTIDVSEGVSGGTKPYTFSIDYARYTDPALGYPSTADYFAPTWLKINPATGELSSDLTSVNRKAQKVRIIVTDAVGDTAYITIAVGPVSDLRFNNTSSGATGFTTGPASGYGVPPANGGTAVYVSGNDTDPPYPKCMHPHYGMIGGAAVGGSGLGQYSFAIVEGPEWLTLGLYGCFCGKYHSDGITLTNTTSTTASVLQQGVRPAGPRPATTVTIKFYDQLGAEEVITLPVGEIWGSTAPFVFANDTKYNIPARIVGTPIPESPKNLDVSRGVSGVLNVEFSLVMANGKSWVEIDQYTGVITGTPGPGDVDAATTATITATAMSGTYIGQTRTITITVGAVMASYLRFEKPATWTDDIPAGETNMAFSAVDCGCCASGGVGPYTFSIDFEEGNPADWSSWISINASTGIIPAGTRPATERAENIAKVTVKDALNTERSIAVVVGAVTSVPLVFVWESGFDIPAGVTGTAITSVNISNAVSGGAIPYTYSMTLADSSTWLSINTSTGVISGTRGSPAAATTATITVTDSSGKTRDITISVGAITNVPPPPLVFTYSSAFDIPTGMVGKAIAPVNVSTGVTGGGPGAPGVPVYTYSIVGPSWLSINPATGVITGTPSAADSTMSATVFVTDNAAPPATKSITITVGAVAIPLPLRFTKLVTHDIPASVAGVPIAPVDVSDGVLGGTIPYVFSIVSGPSWLSINPATGVITGTPPHPPPTLNATTATIRVTDSATPTADSKTIVIFVGAVSPAPLVFTNSSSYDVPARMTGDYVSPTIDVSGGVSGGTTPYRFSMVVADGSTWLSINPTTGVISGMPMDPAPATTATITVTDNAGLLASITINVGAVGGIALLRFTYSSSFDIPARVINTPISPPVNVYGGVYGGSPSYTFTITGPTWLSINPATGVITGTPTAAAASTTAVIRVTDSVGAWKEITINVGAVTPPLTFTKIPAYDIPGGTLNTPITAVNVYGGVSGGTRPYTFTITGPAWLSIDPATGVITGAPSATTPLTSTATVTVTDNAVPADSKSITINIGPITDPLSFSMPPFRSVPDSTEGVAIAAVNMAGCAGGGTMPYTFSITGPGWLSINPATGVISGTPTAAAAATTAVVTVVDSANPPATRSLTITVGEVTASSVPLPLFFNKLLGFDIPAGMVGMAIAPVDVSDGAGGGTRPYTFSMTGPAWLSINPTTGVITGTPTAVAAAATATITVRDNTGATKVISSPIIVGAVVASVVPQPLSFIKLNGFDIPAGEANTAIAPVNVSTGAYGGTPSYTFSIAGPTWLIINPTTGIITGTPTAGAAATTATVTVRDSASPAATKSVQITVGAVTPPPPPLTGNGGSVSVPGGTEGTTVNVGVSGAVSGGYTPYTYGITGGPSWLTINSATGVLSGTRPPAPVAATTATITITDARGNTTSFTIQIGAIAARGGGTTVKYIFSTKWKSTFINWLLFFLLFGWIWMWFINPR